MSGLFRRVVFPVSSFIHQRTLAVFIPHRVNSTSGSDAGSGSGSGSGSESGSGSGSGGKDTGKKFQERMKELFDLFDTDGNGKIDGDELTSAVVEGLYLNETTDADAEAAGRVSHAIMKDCDTDNDGLIDFGEFCAGIQQHGTLFLITDELQEKKQQDESEEDVKVEDVKVEDVKVEDVKVEDVKVEDVKVEDVKVEDVKAEDVKAEDDKAKDD